MDWNTIWTKILDVLTSGGITLLKVIGVFVVGYLLIRVLKIVIRKILYKTPLTKLIQKYVMNAITFVLYVALLLIILQVIGIQVSALLAAIAAAGLALALALQDTLKSITNGIVLIVTKPFKENDFVHIDGVTGRVKSINFFTTTIETLDNHKIIIPNKNMVNFTIENNTYYEKRRFSYKFKVTHSTDISKLEEIVINAILSNPNVYTDPKPVLLCKSIEENGVEFEARGWCPSEMPLFEITEAEVLKTLYNELKKNGIEIANKQLVVFNEKRPASYVDNTPLPERDMSVQPTTTHQQDVSFFDYVDNIENKHSSKLKKHFKKPKKQTKKIKKN